MLITPKHPFLKLSSQIADICKPLELLNISHFTYQKQFNDGSRISLSNKPQWIEDYYNLQLFDTSLFEANPSLYQPRFDVWVGDYDLEVYRHGKLYYNTSPSITIAEPQSNGCAFYLFSSSSEYQHAINFLSNNRDALYHFILYFKDKAASHIQKAQNNKIIIPANNKITDLPELLTAQTVSANMLERKKKFFKTTRIHKYIFDDKELNGIKLTNREIDCITCLLNNKTATQTAQFMNISQRTVESYLENIKTKFNCHSKSELYIKLKQHPLILFIR